MSGPMLMTALAVAAAAPEASAQPARSPADRDIVMDEEGVLRWQDDRSEVALFGVNYYPPFSIDYDQLKGMGADIERVIREDVAHFERMGLDAIRLHVFDREISDEKGNLIDNEHLQLLDYLIDQCRRRGIYTVLTAIAWWQAPGEHRGFSDVYSQAEMIVDPQAIEAQRNYLRQFVTHRNRYTGKPYGEDPAVACFELINEPIPAPGTSDDQIVAYIDALCDAIRGTGSRKLIFFNGWGGRLGAVGRSRADGSTFGWYPTGLVAGHMLTADFLARVDDYPSMRDATLRGKGKIVYEFDAADVPGGYIYPAMARGFRSGGAQIATQFQYDCLPLATTNVNWQTHYLNLVYAPHRAVSFIIAGEAFRRLPRLQTYGQHPQSDRFGDFRVSYEEQLSEMVTATAFLYSNDTKTEPPTPGELRRIVGCGSSPVVQYGGTGAYFLDRVAEGTWRLEVYPDDVWVADPFGAPSLDREVSRVYWRKRPMTIRLPDLGQAFVVGVAVGEAPMATAAATNGRIEVAPGVYVLRRQGITATPKVSTEFVAPPQRDLSPVVWHTPALGVLEGQPLPIEATVAALAPEAVTLSVRLIDGQVSKLSLEPAGPYRYRTAIGGGLLPKGEVAYCISVREAGKDLVFPTPEAGPVEGRFVARKPVPILAFAKGEALPAMEFGGAPGQKAEREIVPGSQEGRYAVRLAATGFGPPPSAGGVKLPVNAVSDALKGYSVLVVRARRTEPWTSGLEVGLVEADGSAHGCVVPLSEAFHDYRVPFAQMRPLWSTRGGTVHPERVAEVSLVFGSWLFPDAANEPHGLEVESVTLEYAPPVWRVPVLTRQDPVVLLSPSSEIRTVDSPVHSSQSTVAGSTPGSSAWRFSVKAFGPEPNCASARVDLGPTIDLWRPIIAGHETLRLRARAGEPTTTAVEIVLTERDGTPWGTAAKLTTEWQDIRIPLADLTHFAHWSGTPQGRGGEGDHCRVAGIETLSITYGAWLYPDHTDEPHSIEFEFIRLE
jgi:Cellulase (glycosyl hydrolase family 5)